MGDSVATHGDNASPQRITVRKMTVGATCFVSSAFCGGRSFNCCKMA